MRAGEDPPREIRHVLVAAASIVAVECGNGMSGKIQKMPVTDIEITCQNESETERLGDALGRALEPGSVVALCGNLGAGKTRLVRAMAEGLGVDPAVVRSPTFLLIQEYAGRVPVYHFDTYRLRDVDEFEQLGSDELLESDGICLIEWADRVAETLPRDHLKVDIEITGETKRLFRISATGTKSQEIVERLRDATK